MAVVSQGDRRVVLTRDGRACVRCGATSGLTMQHRAAVGSGGTSLRVGFDGLLTACAVCNAGFEASLQTVALVYGWKVRSWALAGVVPVYFLTRDVWAVLMPSGRLAVIPTADAAVMMRAAYGPQWEGWVAESSTRFGMRGVAL